jgi:hypothetical protein
MTTSTACCVDVDDGVLVGGVLRRCRRRRAASTVCCVDVDDGVLGRLFAASTSMTTSTACCIDVDDGMLVDGVLRRRRRRRARRRCAASTPTTACSSTTQCVDGDDNVDGVLRKASTTAHGVGGDDDVDDNVDGILR